MSDDPAGLLDCTTAETAVQSVSEILGTKPAELRQLWGTFTFDDSRFENEPPEDRLPLHLGYTELPSPTAIRWFHATTGILPGTSFSGGILPTADALPHVWKALGVVVERRGWLSKAEWQRFMETSSGSDTFGARQFLQKCIAPGWQGPFAFLVRDAAVSGGEAGHRDFTVLSEAAEDIGLVFEEIYHRPLRKAVRSEVRPCLVVFKRPGDWYGAMRAALNHAYRAERGLSQTRYCNTCFSGGGQAVPSAWIERVEPLRTLRSNR